MDWVVDTDMGLDDQISLLYLAKVIQQPNSTFKLKAVLTQGTGLAHAQPGKTNAVRLLRYGGIAKENLPPIGIGSENPLDGFHQYPEAWRIEEDNLRGAQIPPYSKDAQSFTQSSTNVLTEILKNSKQKVSILSLGTFTTLAQVLSKSPRLAKKIDKIVCMAGAVNTPGNLHGARNKVAEFNAWIDPVATKVVFNSGIPITMVPLDATNHAPLTRSFLNTFKQKTSGPAAELISYWWESALSKPVGEYFHWDPLATAIAVSDDIITRARPTKIQVDASFRRLLQPVDEPFGKPKNVSSLNWLGKQRKQLNPYTAGWTRPVPRFYGKTVDVVYKADIPLFEATMIDAFSNHTVSPGPPLA